MNMKKIKSLSSVRTLSRNDYIQTTLNLARASGNDYGIQLANCIASGTLPNLDVSPSEFTDPSSYFEIKQLSSLFSKNPNLDFGIDKKEAALARALSGESQCARTNRFFKDLSKGNIQLPTSTWNLIHSARYFVRQILGEYDHSRVHPDFGPGATSLLKGSFTNLISKLGNLPECTSYGHDFIMRTILDKMPAYSISCGLVERGKHYVRLTSRHLPVKNHDTISFVPKSFKTDRAIFIGPMGNTMVQKGQGSYIRSRMRAYGYDLDTRAELHGEFARLGSIDGSIATIDLANASDTISKEVVRFLLPVDWFDALYSTRVHYSDYGEGPVANEKFSAMGNGYTWELESMLFLAICLAVRYLDGSPDMICSTFGDDICCSSGIAKPIISALTFFGFTINNEKSFTDGPFRESCGYDYFLGHNVTPIYFKDIHDDRKSIETLYALLNRIRAMAHKYNINIGCDRRFRNVWEAVLRRVPPDLRFYGNVELGDQVILAPYSGYRGQYLQRNTRKWRIPINGDHTLACALYGISSGGVSYRGAPFEICRVNGFKQKQTLWLHWL